MKDDIRILKVTEDRRKRKRRKRKKGNVVLHPTDGGVFVV